MWLIAGFDDEGSPCNGVCWACILSGFDATITAVNKIRNKANQWPYTKFTILRKPRDYNLQSLNNFKVINEGLKNNMKYESKISTLLPDECCSSDDAPLPSSLLFVSSSKSEYVKSASSAPMLLARFAHVRSVNCSVLSDSLLSVTGRNLSQKNQKNKQTQNKTVIRTQNYRLVK